MRFTWVCGVWCVVLALGWTTTILASADVALGTAHNWWWVFLGSSAFANLMCVGTGVLAIWRMSAPTARVWSIAYAAGREAGRAEQAANVVPMQRRASMN